MKIFPGLELPVLLRAGRQIVSRRKWMPAYGFHVESAWPLPRTHGCRRPHQDAAREFFDLAGTPGYIAQTQPEDVTLGHDPPRLQDYGDPPKSIVISSSAFKVDPVQHLREQS